MTDNSTTTLRNWMIIVGALDKSLNEYKVYLFGNVINHPKHLNGKLVKTSRVIKADGRFITTKSGTIYYLDGEPSEEYLAWLEFHNIPYNSETPILTTKPGN